MTGSLELLGGLTLEDGGTWAERAQPFQLDDASALLAPDGPRFHFWLRGRGMSKTTDAAALAFALLVTEAPSRSRSYAYAVDQHQAALLLDAMGGLAERSGLLGLVDMGARSVECRATGATLSVEASDSASAFGTRPWLIVVDEAALWPDAPNYTRLWTAVLGALPKVPGSRLLVLSSAGAPGSQAHKRWLAAKAGRHWRASCHPGPSPWWSPADIEAARQDLLPAEYARFIECKWVAADDALATADDVRACTGAYVVREPVRGVQYRMALDIGVKRDRTVVAVGHLERGPVGPVVVVDRVQRWQGSPNSPVDFADLEQAVVAMHRLYRRARLTYDPWQAAMLTERLRRAGVATTEFAFSTGSVNRLARSLYSALRDRSVTLPDDPVLTAELASVRLAETGPGLVRLEHHAGQHDDQAVAVGLLVTTLGEEAAKGGHLRIRSPNQRGRRLPKLRLDRRDQPPPEPPPAVVRQSERPPPGARRGPGGRIVIPRNHPGYQPPRPR